MSIQVREIAPSTILQPYIVYFWEGYFNTADSDLLSYQVIPNGYLELIIHLSDHHCALPQDGHFDKSPDYTLIGVYTRPYEVRFPKKVKTFGMRLKPEGILPLFGMPAAELMEKMADMESVTGRRFRDFCDHLREKENMKERMALSESYLKNNLSKIETERYYLHHAAEIIREADGLISMDELTGKVFISRRQLERAFKQSVGLTPKRYMRIARLNAVNRQLQEGRSMNLTKLAYACGYADQAHFIRDFKAFTGIQPTVFLKEREQYIVNPQN